MKHLPRLVLAAVLCLLPFTASAESSASAAEVKALCELMTARHLDAIAVQDPGDPNHFIAALFYPNAQLLVISARYNTPAALKGLIDAKKYHEVYADLQSAQGVSDQVLFIDMQADGLSAGHTDGIDVMYEPGNKQTVFDEEWAKQHGLTGSAYLAKYQAADRLYESLLRTLSAANPEGE